MGNEHLEGQATQPVNKAFDGKGNQYVEVDNIRLTFVPAQKRRRSKDWSGKNVIRVQAYRGRRDGKAMHRGAELPIEDGDTVLKLVSAICELYDGRPREATTSRESTGGVG